MNPSEIIRKNKLRRDGELIFLRKDTAELIGKIDIEISDDEKESERGMMDRSNIGEDQGMLFILEEYVERSFWMKNTPIPLDIIFADASKQIIKIYENAIPFSEKFLSSGIPVKYTIEVKAGYCENVGIQEGDRFSYSIKSMSC